MPLRKPAVAQGSERATTHAWLTTHEAAAKLRVSTRTIARYVKAGRLPVYKTPGGHCRFKPDDVDALYREPAPLVADRSKLSIMPVMLPDGRLVSREVDARTWVRQSLHRRALRAGLIPAPQPDAQEVPPCKRR